MAANLGFANVVAVERRRCDAVWACKYRRNDQSQWRTLDVVSQGRWHCNRLGHGSTTGFGGGRSGRGSNGRRFGGSGDGSGGNDAGRGSEDDGASAVLSSFGRSVDSLPGDVAQAVSKGLVSSDLMRRYLQAEKSWIGWPLRSWKPFRDRFLSDPQFLFKVMVQEIIGNGTALASEIAVRKGEIWDEMEYVVSDLMVGTFVEAAFVWILAPRVPFPSLASPSSSKLGRFLSSLPSHSFEASSANRSFSLFQRIAAFFNSGWTYGITGLGCGVVGTALTYGFISSRRYFDRQYVPTRDLPPVVHNSLGWAAFMVLSANTRFQLLEGLERAVSTTFAAHTSAVNSLIVALRFANNYWGGVQFIQFFRWVGLQEDSSSHHSPTPPKEKAKKQ